MKCVQKGDIMVHATMTNFRDDQRRRPATQKEPDLYLLAIEMNKMSKIPRG